MSIIPDIEIDGRTIAVYVSGDTREEIEMKALDGARNFFGPDVRLEIIPVYRIVYSTSAHKGHRGEGYVPVKVVG